MSEGDSENMLRALLETLGVYKSKKSREKNTPNRRRFWRFEFDSAAESGPMRSRRGPKSTTELSTCIFQFTCLSKPEEQMYRQSKSDPSLDGMIQNPSSCSGMICNIMRGQTQTVDRSGTVRCRWV